MSAILSTLTPDQLTLLAGALVSVVHSGLVKTALARIEKLSDQHKKTINVVVSIVFPLVIAVAHALHSNAAFNTAFPMWGEVYLTAQAWYYTVGKAVKVIRSWYEAYVILNAKPVAPEGNF